MNKELLKMRNFMSYIRYVQNIFFLDAIKALYQNHMHIYQAIILSLSLCQVYDTNLQVFHLKYLF
jgi:uncharacterized protein YciW